LSKAVNASTASLLIDGPQHASRTIVLAHGAGAPMDSPFMNVFAAGLAERGFRVVRFEFPYMAKRRKSGKRGPPDREPVLRQAYLNVIESLHVERPAIGGKSLGGRIASLITEEAGAGKLVCLGYPFHPPGKPDVLRTAHLEHMKTPMLIVQGQRDSLGSQEEVAGYALSHTIEFHWLADGDHSFKPRKSSGRTEEQNWQEGIEAVAAFLRP